MEFLTHSRTDLPKAHAMADAVARRKGGRIARIERAWLVLVLWLFVASAVGDLHAQTQVNQKEYQLKAAFLLNFTKFVEWPATAFDAPDTPITICVLGVDPFGPILDRMVEGENVNGRTVRTRRTIPEANLQGCHVAFISRFERQGIARIVSDLGNSAVLTVSELRGFAASGGMIEFIIEEEKVGFYINAATAEAAGLKLSSRLLRVAKELRGSGG